MTVVDVLMATFNRPESTARCLSSLERSAAQAGVRVRIVVADASTNTLTADAVEASGLAVDLVRVPSSFHWAAAMRRAWEVGAASRGDYVCWLNDDVVLAPDALRTLLDAAAQFGGRCVVGGGMVGPDGETTYSGYRVGPRGRRLRFSRVPIQTVAQQCDALNGNLVLTDWTTDAEVGGFPARYSHGIADFAYTLRARRRGVPVVLAPGPAGECALNLSAGGGWTDTGLPRRERWRRLNSSKGLPFKEWSRFCLENGGPSGFVYAVFPWLRVLAGR